MKVFELSLDYKGQLWSRQPLLEAMNAVVSLLPDTLVVLAAPPGKEWRAGTEAAQDTGSSVLTAATTLLSSWMRRKTETTKSTNGLNLFSSIQD